MIAGIIKPTGGRIFFDGVDITDMSITTGQRWASVLHFSSRCVLKG